jgi:hypothetical protein
VQAFPSSEVHAKADIGKAARHITADKIIAVNRLPLFFKKCFIDFTILSKMGIKNSSVFCLTEG